MSRNARNTLILVLSFYPLTVLGGVSESNSKFSSGNTTYCIIKNKEQHFELTGSRAAHAFKAGDVIPCRENENGSFDFEMPLSEPDFHTGNPPKDKFLLRMNIGASNIAVGDAHDIRFDTALASLYPQPGLSPDYCRIYPNKQQCKDRRNLSHEGVSRIEIANARLFLPYETTADQAEARSAPLFYQLKVIPKDSGAEPLYGWVPAQSIHLLESAPESMSSEGLKRFLQKDTTPAPALTEAPCPPTPAIEKSFPELKEIKGVYAFLKNAHIESDAKDTEKVASTIQSYFDCKDGKKLDELKKNRADLFREVIYPHYTELAQNRSQLPMVNDTPVSPMKLLAIDALARTVFGEMRGCIRSGGWQYPLAVAKVIHNRARALDCNKDQKKAFQKRFANNYPELPLSSYNTNQLIPFVATAGDMNPKNDLGRTFDTWRPSDNNYDDLMCPKPSEKKIFEDCVAIASLAVLQPEEFKRITAQVKGYNYTSNINYRNASKSDASGSKKGSWEKLTGVSVANRPISNDGCIILWKENFSMDPKTGAAKSIPFIDELEKSCDGP
jgi:hypothetical protein